MAHPFTVRGLCDWRMRTAATPLLIAVLLMASVSGCAASKGAGTHSGVAVRPSPSASAATRLNDFTDDQYHEIIANLPEIGVQHPDYGEAFDKMSTADMNFILNISKRQDDGAYSSVEEIMEQTQAQSQ
jgi:hypothetical protein